MVLLLKILSKIAILSYKKLLLPLQCRLNEKKFFDAVKLMGFYCSIV